MKRKRQNIKINYLNNRINIGFFSFLIIFALSTLIYTHNLDEHKKIIKSYCGDYGYYGQKLILKDNNKFIFNMHGCSQNYKNYQGLYELVDGLLTLHFTNKEISDTVNSKYQLIDNVLIPENLNFEKLVDCKDDNYLIIE
jgi:hypothetical protein